MRATDILEMRPEGLHCPAAGVFIDPHRPVDRAIVTHGHADHCRPGHRRILATPQTLAIARARYGETAFGAAQA
ncbi:MAG: DNA ligase-associated DEXH box helicase, partial [Pseudomonadota bacterium]